MIRIFILSFVSLFSVEAFAGNFLTEREKASIPSVELSFGVTAMLGTDFQNHSEKPATIVANGSIYGGLVSIIERNGQHAFIVDDLTLARLKTFPAIMFAAGLGEPEKVEAPVCDSSCADDVMFGMWDGFISGGSGGAAIGAGLGGGAGFYVAGPPGAAAGAAVGGAAGAVVGGAVGTAVGGVKAGIACGEKKEEAGCQP